MKALGSQKTISYLNEYLFFQEEIKRKNQTSAQIVVKDVWEKMKSISPVLNPEIWPSNYTKVT